jgi:hypothetical protein
MRPTGAKQSAVMTTPKEGGGYVPGQSSDTEYRQDVQRTRQNLVTFLKDEIDFEDPFMKLQPEKEKVCFVSLMMFEAVPSRIQSRCLRPAPVSRWYAQWPCSSSLQITECRVRTVSSKGKLKVKETLHCRKSPAETTFLDDILMFVVRCGASGVEER